jgi:hypothetical protein
MSQYFEQALAAKLIGTTGITSLLGTQPSSAPAIWNTAIPQTWQLDAGGPALTYNVPTKPFGQVLTGSDGTAAARVTLAAFSYSYGISKQILEAVRQAIAGPPVNPWGDGSCNIMSVVQQPDVEMPYRPKAGADQWVYQMISEYRIQYRVSIPSLS